MGSARAVTRLAVLIAIAMTLQIAEALVPKPLPWLRLGLANVAGLLVLIRLGAAAAFALTILRVIGGGLLLGTFGGPAFALSATGSLLAMAVMTLAWRFAAPPLSLLGVSVAGSAAHVAGQLFAFAGLFAAGRGALALAPLLLLTAVPVGLVTGALVTAVHRRLPEW